MNRQLRWLIPVGIFIGFQFGLIKQKLKKQQEMLDLLATNVVMLNDFVERQDQVEVDEAFENIVTEEFPGGLE